jgi:hypothetical protein
MDVLEGLIQRSDKWRDWETDPEPAIEMIQEEAMGIGETWATNLAANMSLWLQSHP